MQPSAALSKFATWSRNLGVACAVRYSLYRIFHRALGERLLTLNVRGFPRPVYCRAGGSDLRVFAQVLANREYRCLDQSEISGLVIDCGANIGLSTLYFLRRFPNAHVIALEPDPDNFKMLARNTAGFSDRATLLQTAVWNKTRGLSSRILALSIARNGRRRAVKLKNARFRKFRRLTFQESSGCHLSKGLGS
jgi:methyltransferase FkbM-like protein